jgi:DNA repair exonuclease SbcCD ATPase subunit
MKIKKVEFKNFNSYGNKLQSLEFGKSGDFYLVLGDNGSGKSSISDVIKFGIYGRINTKRISDLPNRYNKNLFVKIYIEKNKNTEIIIERGVAPNYLKLFINRKEYDQAGKKNIENYIENELIGIPYYVFNNIISLSINDFKSFLNMSSNDKRMIVDKIFSLEILNTIRTLVKDEIKNIKNNIFLLEKEIEMIDRQIKEFETELTKLENSLKIDFKKKSDGISTKINKATTKINEINDLMKKIETKETKILDDISILNDEISKKKFQKKEISKKIKLYENDQCPTCGSNLKTEEHQHLHSEFIKDDIKIQENLESLNISLKNIRDSREKIDSKKRIINDQKTRVLLVIQRLETESFESKKNMSGSKTTSFIKKQKKNITIKRTSIAKKEDSQGNKQTFYKLIDDIFGDKGVKQLALQKILPTLNMEIKKVLLNMSMNDYIVKFDTKFDPHITQLGHVVSVQQLSTGERKKMDFAILLALVRLLKIKHSGMNLIFLDEIFSSIDADGIFHILEILKSNTTELNLNIFVINFSPLPSEQFDYKIEVKKLNNFSNLYIEKMN